ncbi:hypothetical protein BDN70DRAFT_879077 [Pholiota conissans]|uniref:Uncharacterized protein n=1 Tax=Pholiota conissans TaxID=109636 RepID=A0A9P5Z4B6_9AGAR|nr:hypothetical protein BDN70DRAFT_879077 [Pholiota conissans]
MATDCTNTTTKINIRKKDIHQTDAQLAGRCTEAPRKEHYAQPPNVLETQAACAAKKAMFSVKRASA